MWGQCRLGKLLSPAQQRFFVNRVPLWLDLLPPSTPLGFRMMRLPWTKVTKSRGTKVMLCQQTTTCDPIVALQHHEAVNLCSNDLPIFLYKSHRGPLCLTRKKLPERCNEIWVGRGIPTITGHSFRIGGTTELLVAGVPLDVVKVMGRRWSSNAFLAYWRSVERIALLNAELLALSSED
jgi:hypothetical protein